MPSTYTTNNGIELIATGEQSGTWGETTNTNLQLLDASLDGQVTVTLASAGTSGSPNDLPVTNGSASNGRNRIVIFNDGADLGATAYVQLTPNDAEKIMYIRNSLSGSRDIIVFQGTYNASNDYVVPNGTTAVVFFDGAGTGAVAANVFNNAAFDALQLGTSDVSVNKILDQDDMSGNDASALATQQSIKAYVDSQVGANNELSEVLANGNTSGGTGLTMSSGDDLTLTGASYNVVWDSSDSALEFGDNAKAVFGAGSDLQIYHDGSNSYITDQGTGSLFLEGTNQIKLSGSAGDYFLGQNNGSAYLYYAGALKLYTTSTGIDVTGTAVTDGVTVVGNLDVDGGTIKLDGNSPVGGTNNVALGNQAGQSMTTASTNTLIGSTAGDGLTTGSSNVAVGYGALTTDDVGQWNVAIGRDALQQQNIVSAANTYNTAVGGSALKANITGTANTAVGGLALDANTTANNNTAVGYQSLTANTTGASNVAVGTSALQSNTTASNNIGIGVSALSSNTTGGQNVAVGDNALATNSTGLRSTAVGYWALRQNTASDNTAVGYGSLTANTSGSANTALGRSALALNTTGTNNTAVGHQAGYSNTTGGGNTAVGFAALEANTADNNTAVGYQSLYANTTGDYHTAIGRSALGANTTGLKSVAVGGLVLDANTTGSYNVGMGYQALSGNTTAARNIAIGYQAMFTNTVGNSNVTVGHAALYSNSTGSNNVAIGRSALGLNTASNNTAVGHNSLYSNTTGASNVAVGYEALTANTTGVSNTALGYNSLGANTTGAQNVAVGLGALAANDTASNQTAVGYNSLGANTTGSNNTAIGTSALDANTTGTHNNAFGINALGAVTTGSNNVAMGGATGTNITEGGGNIAIGRNALISVTTTNYNTAIGYDSLRNNTSTNNIAIGPFTLDANTTGSNNVSIGYGALGESTSGSQNTVIGQGAGSTITTGSKNTIIGRYNGNQGDLDIRTSSNYIVLSDGDGNPRVVVDSSGKVKVESKITTQDVSTDFIIGQSDNDIDDSMGDVYLQQSGGGRNGDQGNLYIHGNQTAAGGRDGGLLEIRAARSGTGDGGDVEIHGGTQTGNANINSAQRAGNVTITGGTAINAVAGSASRPAGSIILRAGQNTAQNDQNGDVQFQYHDGTDYQTGLIFEGDTGNLLVGTSSPSLPSTDAFVFLNNGEFRAGNDASSGGSNIELNRENSDGDHIRFYRAGSEVGSIGSVINEPFFVGGNTGFRIVNSSASIVPAESDGTNRDNAIDIGVSGARFKDLYLSGGAYLGGTAAANKLDDYEEGTWTGAVADAESGGNESSTGVAGTYVKIGKIVYVQFNASNISTTGMTAGNDVHITGLPFTSASATGNAKYTGTAHMSVVTFAETPLINLNESSTVLKIIEVRSGAGIDSVLVSQLSSGASDIHGNLVYETT